MVDTLDRSLYNEQRLMSDDREVRKESVQDQIKVYKKMIGIDKDVVKVKHHGRVFMQNPYTANLLSRNMPLLRKLCTVAEKNEVMVL